MTRERFSRSRRGLSDDSAQLQRLRRRRQPTSWADASQRREFLRDNALWQPRPGHSLQNHTGGRSDDASQRLWTYWLLAASGADPSYRRKLVWGDGERGVKRRWRRIPTVSGTDADRRRTAHFS